jgi:hypothetical protein
MSKITLSSLQDPNCPLESLEEASGYPCAGFRHQVAKHPKCPSYLLDKLAKDPDSEVLFAVVEHANCTQDIYTSLYNAPCSDVRAVCKAELSRILRILANCGEEKPTGGLGEALCAYTCEDSKYHDAALASALKCSAPYWFRKGVLL